MEFVFEKGRITFNREISDLDVFVRTFVDALDACGIRYVIVSGYVPILFGRSRETEDVDLFIDRISQVKFAELWAALSSRFECINASSATDAFDEYLSNDTALRFAYIGAFIPNMEVKFPKRDLDRYTLETRVEVLLNGRSLFISALELQIAYKLFLGSEKDLEDALHLWLLFKDHLDFEKLKQHAAQLNVAGKLEELQ